MMARLHHRSVVVLCVAVVLAGCGGAPEQSAQPTSDLQATVQAQVEATLIAQQVEATLQAQASPTAAATEAPEATETTSTVVTQAPTQLPTQATAVPAREARATTATTSAAAVEVEDPTAIQPVADAPQQTLNIQLVFDASGSMADEAGNGETRIAAARRAMERIIALLPENSPNLNVGFRVYGHQGDNTEAGKAESCQSTDLLVPLQGVDKAALRAQTNAFEPTGWTPISLALQKAGEDMRAGSTVQNVIIIVTDGEETCGGDPCAVSAALAQSDAQVRIDVVGFGLTPDIAKTLQCVAQNSNGSLLNPENGDAFVSTLEELVAATVERAYLRIEAIDQTGAPIQTFTILRDAQGEVLGSGAATDAQTDRFFNSSFTGTVRIDLEPGTYQLQVDTNSASNTFQARDTIYTVVVERGKETVARVGLGSVVFANKGVPANVLDELALEELQPGENEWATLIADYEFDLDKEYQLQPGRYRVRDTNKGDVIAETVVVPGEQRTLDIGVTRSTVVIQAIDQNGEPIDVFVILRDAAGEVLGAVEDPTTGALFNSSVNGEASANLDPGSYVLQVDTNDASNLFQARDTNYPVTLGAGETKTVVVGLGSATFKQAGVAGATQQNFRLEELREGESEWRTIVADYEFEFNNEYQLQPGRYRVYDTERKQTVGQPITIEPGKRVTVDIT